MSLCGFFEDPPFFFFFPFLLSDSLQPTIHREQYAARVLNRLRVQRSACGMRRGRLCSVYAVCSVALCGDPVRPCLTENSLSIHICLAVDQMLQDVCTLVYRIAHCPVERKGAAVHHVQLGDVLLQLCLMCVTTM